MNASHVTLGNDPFVAVLEREGIQNVLATLHHNERTVILLHYWADLTLEGVAERMGTSLGTVKSRLNRALVKIRGRLNEAGKQVTS
jgi:RNA polymerase sigma factor (sigma-70 family)